MDLPPFRTLFAALLVVLALLSLTSLPAQGQSASEMVVLHVRVTDATSKAVVDVPESSFRISEDGVPQTIAMFSKEEVPLSYGMVIDNSGSLRRYLSDVVRAGIRIVKTNKPTDEAFLLRFISSDKIQTVQDTTSQPQLLINGLSSLYVEGGQTAIIDAVYLGVDKLAKEAGAGNVVRRRAIILVTDGEERNSFYKLEQLLQLLASTDIQIYTIGFTHDLKGQSFDRARALLSQLAMDTGGRAFFPMSGAEIEHITDSIINDIRTQYVIGYVPSKTQGQKPFHKVEVSIVDDPKQEKRIAVTRLGYSPAVKQ
jgi:Ca-activated chloride channel family protein